MSVGERESNQRKTLTTLFCSDEPKLRKESHHHHRSAVSRSEIRHWGERSSESLLFHTESCMFAERMKMNVFYLLIVAFRHSRCRENIHQHRRISYEIACTFADGFLLSQNVSPPGLYDRHLLVLIIDTQYLLPFFKTLRGDTYMQM